MTNEEIRKAVAAQIINMIDNDIILDNGGESFIGWLEDGEVFRTNGINEKDVKKAMELVKHINDNVTDIVYNLENYFD